MFWAMCNVPRATSCQRPQRNALRAAGWLVGLAVAGCHTVPRPALRPFDPRADLVAQARGWRQEAGLPAARDQLAAALPQLDHSHGALERRLLRTHADKSLCYPATLATLTPTERARTGFFFVLGYRPRKVRSERVIREAVEGMRERGWHARLVEVGRHRPTTDDAAALQALLAAELPKVDRAVLVGFSKGGADCMEWFAGPARDLPARQRSKIRLLMSVAGALRGSSVADWIAEGPGSGAFAVRTMVRIREPEGRDAVEEARSMGSDPWAEGRLGTLRAIAPHLEALSVVAVPDGVDGYPTTDPQMRSLSLLAGAGRKEIGPNDGMVETGAQVLPAAAGVRQRIIRVFGSHSVLDSRYADGCRVAHAYRLDAKGDAHWKSGLELLDDLMRAVPRSLAGW